MEVLLPAAAVGDVRRGDEELADDVVILGEELVVNIHQLALADRGGRLLARHILGALGQVELAEAHGNGAGGNENDLVARVLQVAERFAQPLHPLNVQPSCGVGERGGAHLDNDTHKKGSFLSVTNKSDLHYSTAFRILHYLSAILNAARCIFSRAAKKCTRKPQALGAFSQSTISTDTFSPVRCA